MGVNISLSFEQSGVQFGFPRDVTACCDQQRWVPGGAWQGGDGHSGFRSHIFLLC